MQSSTNPCIYLGLIRNIQGSQWFLNTRTGRRIKRYTFTPLPVPPHTIDRFHELADEGNQNSALKFCECYGNPI